MSTRRLTLSLLAALFAAPVTPARAQSDSVSRTPLFTGADAILAAGVLLGARLIHPLDEHFQRRLQDSSTQANRKLQLLSKIVRTTAAPGAYIIGGTLYAAGRLGRSRNLAELGLYGTEALLVGEVTATTLKGMVGRARPYVGSGPNDYMFGRGFSSGDFKSFPSGHSVAAFAAAAAVTSETARMAPNFRWIVGPIMYGGAALVGASRMYNNVHWASDVIVGAGIGTFAGLKVVRYQEAHPGNRLNQWLLSGSLSPNGTGGQQLHWTLMPGGLPQLSHASH